MNKKNNNIKKKIAEEDETLKISKAIQTSIEEKTSGILITKEIKSFLNKKNFAFYLISLLLLIIFGMFIYIWNKKEFELKKFLEEKEKEFSRIKKEIDNLRRNFLKKDNDFNESQNHFSEEMKIFQKKEIELEKSKKKLFEEKQNLEENKKLFEYKENNQTQERKSIFKEIHIAYTLEDKYSLPTAVSITSACENANNLFYFFHILVTFNEIKESNILHLKNIEKKYKRCKIEIIDVGDKLNFFNPVEDEWLSKEKFYILSLSSLLPNISRVIYLHEDTVVLDNLEEMYNLKMENNFVAGYLDPYYYKKWFEEQYKVRSKYFICTGVSLWDLELMRKHQTEEKFMEYLKENKGKKIIQGEQGIINYICINYTFPLPPQYGLFSYYSPKGIYNYLNDFPKEEEYYNIKEHIEAFANPSIVHISYPRPWELVELSPHGDTFFKYLLKTDYYHEHLKYYLETIRKEEQRK